MADKETGVMNRAIITQTEQIYNVFLPDEIISK
jgi:hypothetical protein